MELETVIPRKISKPPEMSKLLNSSDTTVLDILSEPLTFRLFKQEDPQIIELYVLNFLTPALLKMFHSY